VADNVPFLMDVTAGTERRLRIDNY